MNGIPLAWRWTRRLIRLLYISPYKFNANAPLTYLGPYSYVEYAIMYNNLSGNVDEYVRFSQAEMDPYSEIQYAWTFARENRVADFQVKGKQDAASLETLESVFFTYQDPEFPNHATTSSVLIPSTGRKLMFTFWLQPGKQTWFTSSLGLVRIVWPRIPWRWLNWSIKTVFPQFASAAPLIRNSWKTRRQRTCPDIYRWTATICTSH